MKTYIKRYVILRVCMLVIACTSFVMSSAHDIEADGLFFTVNLTERTATLDSCDASKAGDVTVPTAVTLKTRNFTVIKVLAGAFKNCKRLSSVTIPAGIAVSKSLFAGCTALLSVSLPSDIDSIPNSMFRDCTNLRSINIPKRVSFIGDNAFNGCKQLPSISIPEEVTQIGSYAFANTDFKNITLPEKLKKLENGLFMNSSIESIEVPGNVTELGDSVFYQSLLESIDLPTGLLRMGDYVFGNSKLKSVSIPDNVKIIPNYAFENCFDLSDVRLGQGCEKIYSSAFLNCTSLEFIDLPDNINYIGDGCFEGCTSLKSVNLPQGLKSLYLSDFDVCLNLKYVMLPDNISTVELSQNVGIEEIDMTEQNVGTRYVTSYYDEWKRGTSLMSSNLKRITIASIQEYNYSFDYRSNVDFRLRLNRLKVLPQADGFVRKYYDRYVPIYADSLYLCDASSPINTYYEHYYKGDYKYLYLGRNLQNKGSECTIESAVGDSLHSLVIGPLVTSLKMEKAPKLQRIESLITVPLQVVPSFPKDVYINVPLIVPYGMKAQYEQAPGWKEFFDIQEADVATGLSSVLSNKVVDEIERYNINGQKIYKSQRGINIVRNSDGTVVKTISK